MPANPALAALITESGLSRSRIAAVLRDAGLGTTTTTVSRWVDRGDRPLPEALVRLRQVLGDRLGRPLQPADLGFGDPVAADPDQLLLLPWTAAGGLQAARLLADADGMERRRFLTTLLGAAVTAPAHEWLLARAVGDTASSGTAGGAVPATVVDDLDHITDALRRMDDQLGGPRLLALVDEHLRTVVDLLDGHSYTDTVGRRLHGAAAELQRLGGFLAFDAGQHARAQRYWIAALHAAHAAGDRALGANVLGFMSCQAKDLGQARAAVTLAETARAGLRSRDPRVSAILELRAAEAHATDGAAADCRRAVDAAFTHLAGLRSDTSGPAWAYWMSPLHAHGQAGYCYLRLGDWDRARGHLLAAAGDDDQTREGALRQTLLATTHARQGEIDAAADLGAQAVATLSDRVASPRVVGHLTRLAHDLEPHRAHPAVRDFTDRARHLAAVP